VCAQVVQMILMAILIGTAFLQVDNTQSSIGKRKALLFFCAINRTYSDDLRQCWL
jgi:hypothetical protein